MAVLFWAPSILLQAKLAVRRYRKGLDLKQEATSMKMGL